MFTVLSIDPVAISGEVGEKEHAVTYLRQGTVITWMPGSVKVQLFFPVIYQSKANSLVLIYQLKSQSERTEGKLKGGK